VWLKDWCPNSGGVLCVVLCHVESVLLLAHVWRYQHAGRLCFGVGDLASHKSRRSNV